MDKQDLIEQLISLVESRVRDLDDDEYVDVLEEVSSALDGSVEAKREEMRADEDDFGDVDDFEMFGDDEDDDS